MTCRQLSRYLTLCLMLARASNMSFRRLPMWLVLVFGILLGATLTLTFTFHLEWCAVIDLQQDNTMHFPREGGVSPQPLQITQGHMEQRCVCGKELQILEARTATLNKHSSGISDMDLPRHAPTDDMDTRRTHLDSPGASASIPLQGGWGDQLMVGVVSGQGRPEWLNAVLNTWGADINHLFMFVGDQFAFNHTAARGLPVVRLPSAHTGSMLLSALQYLSQHILSTHRWVLIAAEDLYVRIEWLQQVLSQQDPSKLLYFGRPAMGRKEDAKKLGLKPHERYCLGSSGIVLSSSLLSELKGHFAKCKNTVGFPEDVSLGKCISAILGVQCTQVHSTGTLFFEDFSGLPLDLPYLQKEQFVSLLSYHPIPTVGAMTTVHYHYKQLQFTALFHQLQVLEQQVVDVCVAANGTSSHPVGLDCTTALCPSDKSCPTAGVVTSLATPYQPTSVYDYQSWMYFDSKMVYLDAEVYPGFSLKMKKNLRHELKRAVGVAVRKASESHGKQLKLKKLVNGWVRHNPFLGNEYILDCLFMDSGSKFMSKRVSFVRPLATNYITQKDNTDMATHINMVVPLTKVGQRFREFMDMYQHLVLIKGEKVRLILSVYGQEDIALVSKFVAEYRKNFPSADISIIEGKGTFSRGKALHGGVARLGPTELVFICDVDMRVELPFLERCRKNTIRGHRVYYPEFFKLYNMDYVYHKQNRPSVLTLKRSHGHWAYYSFGMLCMYKSDYDSVGGMDTNIQGWGDEDIVFYNKIVRNRLDVLRAPDKALSHRWHEKHCPNTFPKKQFKHCLSSQQENMADRRELARYIQNVGAELKGSLAGPAADLSSNATVEEDYYDYQ